MTTDRDALRALGLTEYAARAYTALVSLGASDAATVASAGPVPRTKVYAVLADLVKRGWADVEKGRPLRYRARRPSECFERERARLDELLEDALPQLEAQFTDRSKRFAGALWMLDDENDIAKRTRQLVDSARRDVFLVASFPLPGDERDLARSLRAAASRGVRTRLVVPDADTPLARALAHAPIDVRILRVPPRLLAIDAREALVAFPTPREAPMRARGVWIPSTEILDVMGFGLASMWEAAHAIDMPSTPRPKTLKTRKR